MMAGNRDLPVPHEELASPVAAMPPPTEWEVMAGADHTFAGAVAAAVGRVAGFLAAALG